MSIPKVIHYCWFGDNPIPKRYVDYIQEWSRICTDYKFVFWGMDNYDYTKSKYTQKAYELKQWAFLSDYARLDIINTYGGIYLDIDVQLIKKLDIFLDYHSFFGMEKNLDRKLYVNTGLGFGSERDNPLLRELIYLYDNKYVDYQFNQNIACPILQLDVFYKYGFVPKNKVQYINNAVIFPTEYFAPLNCFGKLKITKNTVSIHHYLGSWINDADRDMLLLKKCIYYFGYKTGEYVFQILKRLRN